jgi:7-keto-8-aminopelargonate synthetase-like enzyme
MDATVKLKGYGEVACFCSNNYLGLANHPEVVDAAIDGIRRYGAGTASVRFICGTFDCHHSLEARIAEFYGVEASYTFTSCWNANEAIFPTLCEQGDIIISDELNHASIIDGIRLAAVIKKGLLKTVYRHNDLASLRAKLSEARANPEMTGTIWVVTDGVFSMDGVIADLKGLCELADKHDAIVMVDDSHAVGFTGEQGRGSAVGGHSGDSLRCFHCSPRRSLHTCSRVTPCLAAATEPGSDEATIEATSLSVSFEVPHLSPRFVVPCSTLSASFSLRVPQRRFERRQSMRLPFPWQA